MITTMRSRLTASLATIAVTSATLMGGGVATASAQTTPSQALPRFIPQHLIPQHVMPAVEGAVSQMRAALPPEARTIREDNGNSGLPSLLLLTAVSVGAALYFAHRIVDVHSWWTGEVVTQVAKDETIVVSMCVGVLLALLLSLLNKVTRLGLLSRMAERVTFVLIPPLLLIFLVLGTIFLGVATPTEGGAMGALGAFVMAMVRGRLSFALLKQALTTTTKLSCFVVFILIGSTIFSLVFQGVDGPRWVEHLLTGLPGGQIGFLILVNVMIFFLAFFLDFFELSFIVVPLLAPVADKLGIDLIWFGVLLAVNMQTSFMHPPFGFALFYLRSVAPTVAYTDRITKKLIQPVTTMQIYWGAVPFVLIQVVMVGLIIAFPGIVSSGLDKPEVYDMDKIRLQMESDMTNLEPPVLLPGENTESTDPAMPEPAPEAEPAEEDPLKAMQDELKKDEK